MNRALSDMRKVYSYNRDSLLRTFLNKPYGLFQWKVFLVPSVHRALLLLGLHAYENSVSVTSLIHKKSGEESGSQAGEGDLSHSSCQQTASLVRFAKWHEPPGRFWPLVP